MSGGLSGTFAGLCRGWTLAVLWAVTASMAAASDSATAGQTGALLAPAAQSTAPSSSASQLDKVRRWFGTGSAAADLLPADEAYQLAVRPQDGDTIIATLTPAKDYYIYRNRVQFRIESPPGVSVAKLTFPPGAVKEDPNFGKTEIYQQPFDVVIHLKWDGARAPSVRLHASYQGCHEPLGVCYPPIEKILTVGLGSAAAAAAAPPLAEVPAAEAAAPQADESEAGRIRNLFARAGVWALLGAFFGFGILLAFTPCMLPMIPILSGIIAGQGAAVTRKRALRLSAVYILGMAIAYAVAGVVAGLAGSLVSAALQSPWTLGAFAAIFVLLSLSMFGMYDLQLPTGLQGRLAAASNRLPGGRAVGVFLMGVLSAVIVGPCVAAPLAGALLYISQTRDAVLGGAALFSMAVGMGVPLLAIGASTSALLRRAGPWTVFIKAGFGVALLAMGIYVLSPVIAIVAQHLLWAALLIVSAVFLRAIDPLPAGAPRGLRFFKGVGVIALAAGVALLLGALSGSRDVLQPLAALRGIAAPADAREVRFETVKSVADVNARLASARGRYVMLDFAAEWCVSCKEMERFTFSDPGVQAQLRNMVLLRADLTANSVQDQALLRRFSLFGPPGIVFFDSQGREVPYRVIGFEPPARFLTSLRKVLSASAAGQAPGELRGTLPMGAAPI